MGRVTAPYGVRGWIKVKAFTEVPDALLDYPTWWLSVRGSGATKHRVLEARIHSDHVIARLESLDSRELAAAFRGAEVSVPRDQLPETEEDEVYWSDLAGCDVVNRNGERLGRVAEVQDTGAYPMLRVVSGEAVNAAGGGTQGKVAELLIPFVPAYVLGVDLEANRIDVDWEADY